MGADTGPHAGPVLRRLRAMTCPSGGFTYREPDRAGDALSTAATALLSAADDPRQGQWRTWLPGCRLPNEGGIMYMPARGSEVRCTLWALAAGAADVDPAAPREIANWLKDLQNPGGGFGYWEGRGSDLVSTAAAVETLRLLGIPVSEVLDPARLAEFVLGCRDEQSYRHVPGAPPTLRTGLQRYGSGNNWASPCPANSPACSSGTGWPVADSPTRVRVCRICSAPTKRW
ncbi:prenyltransferase/squalene oxidase repeat-containing protein [Amycolatopsis sp. cmx-11-32]|uniref:prenyltransferase/squalene oxidase repeat-containing protein n=1 Tax=Amycolatopsis sp. cmx-11-32 TaxID=2785796 RepID=UPI0039E28591